MDKRNRLIAVLDAEKIQYFQRATVKKTCAQQAASPGSLPNCISGPDANKHFREALFALADAEFLCADFWREQARAYKIDPRLKLYLDFDTKELFAEENNKQ